MILLWRSAGSVSSESSSSAKKQHGHRPAASSGRLAQYTQSMCASCKTVAEAKVATAATALIDARYFLAFNLH